MIDFQHVEGRVEAGVPAIGSIDVEESPQVPVVVPGLKGDVLLSMVTSDCPLQVASLRAVGEHRTARQHVGLSLFVLAKSDTTMPW